MCFALFLYGLGFFMGWKSEKPIIFLETHSFSVTFSHKNSGKSGWNFPANPSWLLRFFSKGKTRNSQKTARRIWVGSWVNLFFFWSAVVQIPSWNHEREWDDPLWTSHDLWHCKRRLVTSRWCGGFHPEKWGNWSNLTTCTYFSCLGWEKKIATVDSLSKKKLPQDVPQFLWRCPIFLRMAHWPFSVFHVPVLCATV